MRKSLTALSLFLLAANADAGIPQMNVTCGDGIEVHADEGGPVYIDGKEAKLKKFNDNYYEAKLHHTTISISIEPDGRAGAMYTGKHGANGVCTAQDAAESAPAAAGGANPEAETACRKAVAKQVGVDVDEVSVIGSEWSQAGTSVRVSVPGADAPWACVVDSDGSVSEAYFTSEG